MSAFCHPLFPLVLAAHPLSTCMYYDHSTCMYYGHSTCMYYDHSICMYYDHSTCRYYGHSTCMYYDHSMNMVRACMSYDRSTCIMSYRDPSAGSGERSQPGKATGLGYRASNLVTNKQGNKQTISPALVYWYKRNVMPANHINAICDSVRSKRCRCCTEAFQNV